MRTAGSSARLRLRRKGGQQTSDALLFAANGTRFIETLASSPPLAVKRDFSGEV
jgi:hypothetical protein